MSSKDGKGVDNESSDNWCRSSWSINSKFLAEFGVSVTLVARRQEQVNELNAKKLTRINVDGTKTVQRVIATTDLANLPTHDLLVIAVKYGHLQKLYKPLASFPNDTPLLLCKMA